MTAKEAREMAESKYQRDMESARNLIEIAIQMAAKQGNMSVEVYTPPPFEIATELREKGYILSTYQSGINETCTKISW